MIGRSFFVGGGMIKDTEKLKSLNKMISLYEKYPAGFEHSIKLAETNPDAFTGMVKLATSIGGVRFLGGMFLRILVFAAAMIGAWATITGHFNWGDTTSKPGGKSEIRSKNSPD